MAPFLFAALLAYLMQPLVKRLERHPKFFSHIGSVILVFSGVFGIFILFLLMLFPLIQFQVELLINVIPQILTWAQDAFLPWLKEMVNVATIKATLAKVLPMPSQVFSTVVRSGYAIVEWLINIVLVPVVTFYFLRDWDKLTNIFKRVLPVSIKPTVLELLKEFDAVLSKFFRGQLLVMIALGLIYGLGLTAVGLQLGLVIGFIGGLLSIVPYLGSMFVVVASTIAVFVQAGYDSMLYYVWGVFVVGQLIESYILTPSLVGNKIGLHPVAVIFSIMAGGALFGFFGVLVALPAAALIKVLIRYMSKRYHWYGKASNA